MLKNKSGSVSLILINIFQKTLNQKLPKKVHLYLENLQNLFNSYLLNKNSTKVLNIFLYQRKKEKNYHLH